MDEAALQYSGKRRSGGIQSFYEENWRARRGVENHRFVTILFLAVSLGAGHVGALIAENPAGEVPKGCEVI